MLQAQTKQLFLLLAILAWAIIIGAIMYSHVAVMPSFLHHLPQSASLLNSGQGVEDERFWMSVHPVALLLTVITLLLYWKHKPQRKLILATLVIYVLILVCTALYFVPELIRFGKSNSDTSVSAAVWQQRGQLWERLSWVRGVFMYAGFVLLLLVLAKGKTEKG